MSEWKPIETAPRDGDDFLAICAENGFAQVAYYYPAEPESDWIWAVADGVTYHRDLFTHWMPLPTPPAPQA